MARPSSIAAWVAAGLVIGSCARSGKFLRESVRSWIVHPGGRRLSD